MSAAALAVRAGVTENAIRKIESGDSKEPRFSTGLRIAAALGVDANDLVESPQSAAPPNLGRTLRLVREHRKELTECGAAHVAVFGSVARGEANPQSDVDIVVEPRGDKRLSLFDLSALQQKLEEFLGVRVDVVTMPMLRQSPSGRSAAKDAIRAF